MFRVRVVVDGDHVVIPGPILLFIRHASIADTLLANVIATRRHGLLLRYVLKNELLVDPAIDIAGNRLINYFVDRRSGDTATEVARVEALAADLTEDEGVLIYPEGTRYTDEKAARIREKVAEFSESVVVVGDAVGSPFRAGIGVAVVHIDDAV